MNQIPWYFSLVWLLITLLGGYGLERKAKLDMCRQWAGDKAIVFEGACMVRDGGVLRPARKDSE